MALPSQGQPGIVSPFLTGGVNQKKTTAVSQAPAPVVPIASTQQATTTSGLVSTGNGTYKGTQIKPGTDAEIQAQIKAIDTPVSPIKDIPAPNRGLFTNVKDSVSPAVTAPTFGGLVSDLRGASAPSSAQAGYVKKIEDVGRLNERLGTKAEDLSKKYGEEIARVGQLGAGAVAGNLSTGTNVVGSGNAAIASQSASQRMSALAQGANTELSGIEKQLAANAAERQALEASLGGSQFQQSTQIGGLGTAAGLASPSGNYPFVFDPLTGGFTNAGGGGVLTPQQAAQDVMSGKTTYDQAKQALGYLGGTGEAQLQSAVTALGGNPLTLQAQGATQQQVVGDQAAQVAAYTSAHQQAMNLQNQLADLITTFGLNPSNVNVVNAGLQKIAQNTSSAEYKILSNYLVDVASRYAQILTPSGGSQTDTTRATASSMLDGIAGGNSIIAVMNALDEQAKAVIAGVPTTGSPSPFSGGQPQGGSGGLYDF